MFGAVAEASCIVYTFLNIYDWNSFNVLILQLQEASEVVSYKDSDVNSADAGPIEWDRNQVVLICLILSYWHSMHMTCSVHNYINTSDCMRQEKCQSAKTRCRGAGLENWQISGDADVFYLTLFIDKIVSCFNNSENWMFPFHFGKIMWL